MLIKIYNLEKVIDMADLEDKLLPKGRKQTQKMA